MDKKLFLTLSVIAIGTTSLAAPNYDYSQTMKAPLFEKQDYSLPTQQTIDGSQTLKGQVVTVPAGEQFSTVVTSPISSENIIVGQNVSLALGNDFYYNNQLIAPAGSSITGTAIEASKAKHGNINGKLLLRFTQITTPYGIQIPISAVIKTTDNTGVLLGGTKADMAKEYGKDITIGAGAGALAGVIISPLAGGNIGRGTALSTAVGAGGGLVKSIWDKGNDVVIPVNSSIQLVLTQPITVNPENY